MLIGSLLQWFFNVVQNIDLLPNCFTCSYTTTVWSYVVILIEKNDLLHPQIHIHALVLASRSQRKPRSS